MMALGGLIVGLICLFLGGDWLVRGASRLAESFGISPLVVGLTVVAIGTSAPELLVSLSAALGGSSDLAIGNVVGSNIANIGVILGISGLIFPIAVHVDLVRREIPIMIGVAVLAALLVRDASVGRGDGLLLLACLLAFMSFVVWSANRERGRHYAIPEESIEITPVPIHRGREALRLVVGMVVLMVGAQLTVANATTIARSVGVSELVIGITVVAIGTSLPELVTSITAAVRKESDIAIGNVVGSNIFNILAILGTTAVVQPIAVVPQTINVDMPIMVGFSLLLFPFVLDRKLGRLESAAFLTAYIAFTGYTVFANG